MSVSIFLSFLIFSLILVDNSNLDIPVLEQKLKICLSINLVSSCTT